MRPRHSLASGVGFLPRRRSLGTLKPGGTSVAPLQICARRKQDDNPPPPGRVAMQRCRDHKPSLQGSLSWSSDIKASPGIENAFLEMVWGFHYFKSYFEINLDFQKNCIRTILVLLHLIPSVNLRPHLLFFMFIICLLSIHAHAFLI